jgi:hypothetical protein
MVILASDCWPKLRGNTADAILYALVVCANNYVQTLKAFLPLRIIVFVLRSSAYAPGSVISAAGVAAA